MIGDLLGRLTIRMRLTLAFAAVMVVLFGGLALLLHELFSASLDSGINRALRTRASDLATLVDRRDSGDLTTAPVLPESGGAFAQILSARGRILDSTPGHSGHALLHPAEVRAALRHPIVIDKRAGARVLARPLDGRPPTILVVGSSLSQRDAALRSLSEMLFIGGPALLALTCFAGYLLTASALAPVERMRARAARISGAGHARLPVPPRRDELQRLGATLNEMLARLEASVAREKEFVANAGHELRTPLSILKLELELALSGNPSREELESGLTTAAEEVDRLAKLADDLLVIASADQGRLPVEKKPLEVQGVLDAVAQRIAPAAATRGRSVSSENGDHLVVPADAARIEQALDNIVTNALRYGEGAVVLSARARDGTVELHVVDEGPGFAPEFLSRAFERFARADRPGSRGGTGLGLATVRAIAEAHGGRAGAANRAGGGADVWIALPRSRAG